MAKANIRTLDGKLHRAVPQYLIDAALKAKRPFQSLVELQEYAKSVDSPSRLGGERSQSGPQIPVGSSAGMASATA